MNCPNCNSEKVAEIVRGFPALDEMKALYDDIDAGKAILLACSPFAPENRHCHDCGHEWEYKNPGMTDEKIGRKIAYKFEETISTETGKTIYLIKKNSEA